MKKYWKGLLALMALALSVQNCKVVPEIRLVPEQNFEKKVDGRPVKLYTLRNAGLVMQVTNYGARVVSLWTPGRNGVMGDVVLGYDSIDSYLDNPGERFLGAAVGPIANRIGGGTYDLAGESYHFPLNDHGNTLHGGDRGLDRVVWTVEQVTDSSISFSYLHADGQEGFPGNKQILMEYSLTPDNGFKIEYQVKSDRNTHVNLSHHSFFNLHGEGKGDILDHEMKIHASYITEIGPSLIPTGRLLPVEGTPFDFRTAHAIGERIGGEHAQLAAGKGYDHNWVLDKSHPGQVELAASVFEPTSGRMMEIFTDQPGLQFYSGNFFDGKTHGKSGTPYNYRAALALETQFYPDAANQPDFPSTLLVPGEVYRHTCIYRFSVK